MGKKNPKVVKKDSIMDIFDFLREETVEDICSSVEALNFSDETEQEYEEFRRESRKKRNVERETLIEFSQKMLPEVYKILDERLFSIYTHELETPDGSIINLQAEKEEENEKLVGQVTILFLYNRVKRGEFTMRKAAAIAASRIIDNMYEMVE